MNRAFLLVAGLTCFSAVAHAQSRPSPDAPSPPQVAQADSATAVRQLFAQRGDDQDRGWRRDGERGGMDRDRMGRRGREDARDADHDDDTWHRGGRAFGGGRDMDERGWRSLGSGEARFRLRRGDSGVDITCPGGTDLTACVEAAGQLIDRLGAARRTDPTPPPPPPAPVSPPTPPANR